MKNTVDYLDEAKSKLEIESDYALGKTLEMTKGAMGNYRHKRTVISNEACFRLAEILEIDPIQLITLAETERSKGEKRLFWQERLKKYYGRAATWGLVIVASPALFQLAETVYYVK